MRLVSTLIVSAAIQASIGFGSPCSLMALEQPWDDTWTMDIRDETRQYNVLNNKSYLAVHRADFENLERLVDQDICISAKFDRLDDKTLYFYQSPEVIIDDSYYLNDFENGQNIYLIGHVQEIENNKLLIQIHNVIKAPSDKNVVVQKEKTIAKDNYAARIDLALWAQQQSVVQGTQGDWLDIADRVASEAITDAIKVAQSKKSSTLLEKALDLAFRYDPSGRFTARFASSEWIFAEGNENIAHDLDYYMKRKGYMLHNQKWLSEADALTATFDDRFNAIPWRDAQAYYELAMWADSYGDVLPSAQLLRHKALQAAHKADPEHQLTLIALGMQAHGAISLEAKIDNNYRLIGTDITLNGPTGWQAQSAAFDGEKTWATSSSETAYISATLVPERQLPANLEAFVTLQKASFSAKEGYTERPALIPNTVDNSELLSFAYKDGSDSRIGTALFYLNKELGYGAVIFSSTLATEPAHNNTALQNFFRQISSIK